MDTNQRRQANYSAQLSPREHATVLDALQAYLDRRLLNGGWGIVYTARAEHFDRVEPLGPREIEQLYERLRKEPRSI
jgi:hypothetical protein